MRKCKDCNECSGMCRETWEPIGELSITEKVVTFVILVLVIAGLTTLVL